MRKIGRKETGESRGFHKMGKPGHVVVGKERLEAAARNSAWKKEEQSQSLWLGKVASGSATHSLWMRDRKVVS